MNNHRIVIYYKVLFFVALLFHCQFICLKRIDSNVIGMSYIVTLKRCGLSIFNNMFYLDNYNMNFRVGLFYVHI